MIKLINGLIDLINLLAEFTKLALNKIEDKKIEEAINEAKEGDQQKLEEVLFADGGQPSTIDYHGMRTRKAPEDQRRALEDKRDGSSSDKEA